MRTLIEQYGNVVNQVFFSFEQADHQVQLMLAGELREVIC